MKNAITLMSVLFMTILGLVSCSGPAKEEAPRQNSKPTRTDTPIDPGTTTSTTEGTCVPSAANNNCAPTTNLSGSEKCWLKILESDEAKACSSKKKFFNRISKTCVDALPIQAPCDEGAVSTSLGASFTGVADQITAAKQRIKDALGVDAQLDQCAVVNVNGKETLIPIFMGKKFDGDASGNGKYQIHASKVCLKDTKTIADCDSTDTSLKFQGSSTEEKPLECL